MLAGIRVVDFTQVLSGPFASQQLAFLGADVIKVEQPRIGDQSREMMATTDVLAEHLMSPMFISMNVGKRSLTLDLKKPEARPIVERLVGNADVLIQNFKSGTMERMGYGWAEMRAVNPRLVYCAITGYGQTGPRAGAAAYDPAIQAASGMMSITGHPESGPVKTGYWVSDMATGVTAAFAVAAALVARERTGEGRYIDVSMLDTALTFLGPIIGNYLNGGVMPELTGNGSAARNPTSGLFPTGAGDLLLAAATRGQWPLLCRALARPDMAEDPRFVDLDQRKANNEALRAELIAVFATDTAINWEKRLGEAGVPAAAVRSIPEALDSSQVKHREIIRHLPGPSGFGRDLAYVNPAFHLDRDPPGTNLPPPGVGEHTDAILAELGHSPAEIAALRDKGVV